MKTQSAGLPKTSLPKTQLPRNCHFCKITFDPESSYHKGACYTEPDQLYDVCADCVITGTNHIKNKDDDEEFVQPIGSNDVIEQLSLDTGISVSRLTQSENRKED